MGSKQHVDKLLENNASFIENIQQCKTMQNACHLFATHLSSIVPLDTITVFLFDSYKPAIIYSLEYSLKSEQSNKSVPSYITPSDCEMIWDMESSSIISSYNLNIPERKKKELDFIIPLCGFEQKTGFAVVRLDKSKFATVLSSDQKSLLILSKIFAIYLEHYRKELLITPFNITANGTKKYISSSLKQGILVIASDNTITSFNSGAKSLFKLDDTMVILKDFHTVFPINIVKAIEDIQTRLNRTEHIIEYETECCIRYKYPISITLTASKLQTIEGESNNIIIVCQDNTPQKSELVATASHQLKTPLNLITGSVEILENDMGGTLNDKQLRLIQLIKEGGRRLQNLIKNILDISKLDFFAGMEYKPVHVQKIIDECISFHQSAAFEKNITITKKLHTKPLFISGTREHILEVMDNLIGNAIKYTHNNGRISIKLKPIEGKISSYASSSFFVPSDTYNTLELTVSDTGIGISKEDIPHIFSKFQRGSHPFIKQTEGTGLGLSIVRKIIESLDGKISVKSTLGNGTIFKVLLPLYTLSPNKSEHSDFSEQINQARSSYKFNHQKILK